MKLLRQVAEFTKSIGHGMDLRKYELIAEIFENEQTQKLMNTINVKNP